MREAYASIAVGCATNLRVGCPDGIKAGGRTPRSCRRLDARAHASRAQIGKPYDVTIWFVVDGETILLRSANVNTNWPRNLRVNPAATLKIRSHTFQGTALELTNPAK